ncbi:MAG: hypothetical protein QE280_05755 [Caulobacter sp.]|nr:hypothetical protein [Caulobacter sp.]
MTGPGFAVIPGWTREPAARCRKKLFRFMEGRRNGLALQKMGVVGTLIRNAIACMKARKVGRCRRVGDTHYYSRHGFIKAAAQRPQNEPPEYFMVLPLDGPIPAGRFCFHPAFDA